jgi:group I intron endonuclease
MNSIEKDECDITGDINKKKDNLPLKDTTDARVSGIYKIINKVNRKYYVGSSNNIHKRWNEHKSELNKNRHKNNYLQKSYNKHGINNFDFIITEKISVEKLIEIEQKYLDIAKQEKDKCYNLNFIADRVEMTDEIKKKISDGNKGHKMTAENKAILIKISKERIYSDEYKKKISIGTKLHTPRGNNHHNHNNTIYTFRNTDTTDIFTGTFLEFRTKYDLSHGNLSNMIAGKRKSIKSWILI